MNQKSSMSKQTQSVYQGGTTPYHIVWFSLIAAAQSFSARTAEAVISGTMNSASLFRLTLVIFAISILMSQISRRMIIKIDTITIFMIYSFFCIISSIWSISFIPSLGKSAELFFGVLVLFIALNAKSSKPKEHLLNSILNASMLFIIAILTVMLFGYFLAPSIFSSPINNVFSRRLGLENLFISANGVAYLGAIIGSYSFAKLIFKNKFFLNFIIYILSWIVIILAQGRTGAAALLISSALLYIRKFKAVSVPILIFLLIISYSCYGLLESFLIRGESKELLFTLTGRTVLWEKAWFAFLDKPWLGYGFGVGSRYVFLQDISDLNIFISSIHNSYIEVILSVGLIGFIIFIIAFFSSIKLIVRSYIHGNNIEAVSALIPILVASPMTSGLTASWGIMSGIFLVGIAILTNAQRKIH